VRPKRIPYVVDESTGCWVWQMATTRKGYGLVNDGGKVRQAHRVYYERHKGPIPEGLEVHHRCETRNCVNPAHLLATTHRHHLRLGRHVKMTPEKRAAAWALRDVMSQGKIAKALGVSRSAIGDLFTGEHWAD
jgi:hypothetical protein